MIRFAADENFKHRILRGLLRQSPDLDVLVAQREGLAGADDPSVLEWAARQGRVLLTHDVRSMPGFAFESVRRGERLPGVIGVGRHVTRAHAIEELLILAECSEEDELEGRVFFLPL